MFQQDMLSKMRYEGQRMILEGTENNLRRRMEQTNPHCN